MLRAFCAMFAVVAVLVPCSVFAVDQATIDANLATSKTTGQDAGSLVKGRFGTKTTINQNLNVPMTDSTVQMNTLDGSKSFGAALGIPSSNKFLEIFIQPSGTGDISNALVSQDLNSDNAIDHAFNLGVPISGVCANGFISCTPGTWTNCQPYGWQSDAAGKLSKVSVPLTQLSGCFCINSSCGSNLVWTNSSVVLNALGGAAVAAIHVENAATAITNVATEPVLITYYGQLISQSPNAASAAPATASLPGPQEQQSYYGNWSNLDAARDSVSLSQSTDPNSMYYLLTKASPSPNAQTRSCNVTRAGSIDSTVDQSDSNSGNTYLYTEHFIDMQIWRSPDERTYKLQLLDWYKKGLHQGILGSPAHEPMDENRWHTIHTFELPMNTALSAGQLTKALFSMQIVSGSGCTPGSTYTIDGAVQGFNNRVNVGGACSGSGVQRPYLKWSYYFEYRRDEYKESVSDGCSALEADPTCRLKAENVDGVPIITNYTPTGLIQLPSCRNFQGEVQNFEVCKAWWIKQRQYVCEVNTAGYDLTRYRNIKDTTVMSGTSFNFTDYRQNADGSWSSFDMGGVLPQGDSYGACIPSCKVKRAGTLTQTTLSGTVADNMVDNSTFETRYLQCDDNVCPVEPGDEIVTPCGCIDEFAQAAAIMQTMRLSGADNICSDGTAKPP